MHDIIGKIANLYILEILALAILAVPEILGVSIMREEPTGWIFVFGVCALVYKVLVRRGFFEGGI